MDALRQITVPQVLAGLPQSETRSILAIICGLSSNYVTNLYRSSLHSLDLNAKRELTPDEGWQLPWRLVLARRIYCLQYTEQIAQAMGRPTRDSLEASICALAFLTECGLYTISLLYLVGEDHYKHSPSIRRGSILLAVLACLIIAPRSEVLGSLIYQYIPLAALTATACGKYLSHGSKGCHEVSQRRKGDNKCPG